MLKVLGAVQDRSAARLQAASCASAAEAEPAGCSSAARITCRSGWPYSRSSPYSRPYSREAQKERAAQGANLSLAQALS